MKKITTIIKLIIFILLYSYFNITNGFNNTEYKYNFDSVIIGDKILNIYKGKDGNKKFNYQGKNLKNEVTEDFLNKEFFKIDIDKDTVKYDMFCVDGNLLFYYNSKKLRGAEYAKVRSFPIKKNGLSTILVFEGKELLLIDDDIYLKGTTNKECTIKANNFIFKIENKIKDAYIPSKPKIKDIILHKNSLKKIKNGKKYIKLIDNLLIKLNKEQLIKINKKIEKLKNKSNTTKSKVLINYLDISIKYKLYSIKDKKIKDKIKTEKYDLGNGFHLEQTINNTKLIHSSKNIYTWEHKSKKNPFIWDEACKIVFDKFQNYTSREKGWKQNIWDSLSNDEQKQCLKERYTKSISVKKLDNNFYLIKNSGYERSKKLLFDSKNNKIYENELNIYFDEINKIKYGNSGIFYVFKGYLANTGGLVFINKNTNKQKLLFNNNGEDSNNESFKELIDYKLLANKKVKITYKGKNLKSFNKIISIDSGKITQEDINDGKRETLKYYGLDFLDDNLKVDTIKKCEKIIKKYDAFFSGEPININCKEKSKYYGYGYLKVMIMQKIPNKLSFNIYILEEKGSNWILEEIYEYKK